MSNGNYRAEEIFPGTFRIDEFGLGTVYLAVGTQKALLIDTGTGVGDLRGFLKTLTLLPVEVAATHAHVDHIGGRHQFEKMYIGRKDLPDIHHVTAEQRRGYAKCILDTYPTDSPLFSLDEITEGPEPEAVALDEGDTLDLGGRRLRVFETPGHTPGSICLLDEDSRILFTGDTFQHLELLTMTGKDRNEVLGTWLANARRIYALKDRFDLLCGGHEKLEPQVMPDLIACVTGMLDGSIEMKRTKVHIFDGMFAHYGSVYVTINPRMA